MAQRSRLHRRLEISSAVPGHSASWASSQALAPGAARAAPRPQGTGLETQAALIERKIMGSNGNVEILG